MRMKCHDGPFNGRLIEADEHLTEVLIEETSSANGTAKIAAKYRVSRPINEEPRLVHIRGTDDAF